MRNFLMAAVVAVAATTAEAGFWSWLGKSPAPVDGGVTIEDCAAAAAAAAVRVELAPAAAAGEPELVDRIESDSLEDLARGERKAVRTGYLWPDARHVLTEDFLVATNALAPIVVAKGGRAATGVVERIYKDRPFVLLALGNEVGGKPLVAGTGAPVVAARASVRNDRTDGSFLVGVGEIVGDTFDEAGRDMTPADAGVAALFDADGKPCGFLDGRARPCEGTAWSPAAWPWWSPEAWRAVRTAAEVRAAKSVFPVTFRFRAPPVSKFGVSDQDRWSWRHERDEEGGTKGGLEVRALAFAVGGRRLAVPVPASLYQRLPRLESIAVRLPGRAERVKAEFVTALGVAPVVLADLPAGVALETLAADGRPAETAADEAVVLMRAAADGADGVRIRTGRVRTALFERKWRGLVDAGAWVQPMTEGGWRKEDAFLALGADGRWLGANLSVRERSAQIGDRNSWQDDDFRPQMLRAADYARLMAAPAAVDRDLAAAPTAERAEAAKGTLGFDVQVLDKNLAELLHVTKETESGSFGALVTSVDTGSPAARAGVKGGWTLLSLRPEGGVVRRVELEEDESSETSMKSRYWDSEGGEDATGEYYGWSIPWHTRNTALTDALTKLGVGRRVQAEFLADGQRVLKDLVVTAAPPDYKSAPAWKWTAGGISVCNLTDDVRETLALEDDAPGVVVCGRESGSRAVVAGIRPYEIITSVDGAPVKSVEEFEKAVTGRQEARFDVLRLTTTRTVNVKY